MPERHVTVCLEADRADPVCGDGIVLEFTAAQRLKRAGLVMGVFVLLAATLIPVPIVHLFGIPILLITGGAIAVRQLNTSARLKPMRLACPKCGAINRLGGDLGLTSIAEPKAKICESCRLNLTLRVTMSQANG